MVSFCFQVFVFIHSVMSSSKFISLPSQKPSQKPSQQPPQQPPQQPSQQPPQQPPQQPFQKLTRQHRLIEDEERLWTNEHIDSIALKHFPNINKYLVQPFVPPFIHPSIHSPIHPPIHLVSHSPICSFIHFSIHSSIHRLTIHSCTFPALIATEMQHLRGPFCTATGSPRTTCRWNRRNSGITSRPD